MPYARCGACGLSKREEETVRVVGHAGGTYRRAARQINRRVCRECTEDQVQFVKAQQMRGLNSPLDTHHFTWSTAADHFGIDRTCLARSVDEIARRRRGF